MPHYVYILKSLKDGTFYKGYTTDYKRRLTYHNLGLSRYTSTKMPWEMVYVELCADKRTALKRERSLKRSNMNYIRWLIEQESNIIRNPKSDW